MSSYPGTRVQRSDPQVLMLAFVLTSAVFFPMVLLGALALLTWRVVRGYLVGSLATMGVRRRRRRDPGRLFTMRRVTCA